MVQAWMFTSLLIKKSSFGQKLLKDLGLKRGLLFKSWKCLQLQKKGKK